MAGSGRSPRKLSAEWFGRAAAGFAALLLASGSGRPGAGEARLVPYEIVGDAIPAQLTGTASDPVRGRAIVGNRQLGLCLLCHSGPFPEDRLQGSLAPSLAGVASRLSIGQLRLRVVDASRVNPNTIMPPYYRTQDLTRVAPAYTGKPILSAEEVEDVIAFLATLTE
jgi:L-cysteine S-thiosulfotransferase